MTTALSRFGSCLPRKQTEQTEQNKEFAAFVTQCSSKPDSFGSYASKLVTSQDSRENKLLSRFEAQTLVASFLLTLEPHKLNFYFDSQTNGKFEAGHFEQFLKENQAKLVGRVQKKDLEGIKKVGSLRITNGTRSLQVSFTEFGFQHTFTSKA